MNMARVIQYTWLLQLVGVLDCIVYTCLVLCDVVEILRKANILFLIECHHIAVNFRN